MLLILHTRFFSDTFSSTFFALFYCFDVDVLFSCLTDISFEDTYVLNIFFVSICTQSIFEMWINFCSAALQWVTADSEIKV